MIRKKNLFVRPKKAYEKSRITEENKIVEQYGLKNKKEIWKTQAKVDYFRRRAKALSKSSAEEQKVFLDNLQALGLKTSSLADVLALEVQDLLERRLQTVVFKKNISSTPRHARQLLIHKKILLDGRAINIPSYLVSLEEESKIQLKKKDKKVKVEAKAEESKAEEVAA